MKFLWRIKGMLQKEVIWPRCIKDKTIFENEMSFKMSIVM